MKLLLLLLLLAIIPLTQLTHAGEKLPQSLTFIGKAKFDTIVKKAVAENWRKLPIGDRMVKIALELRGTPYKGYTLEIHDRIESPSANFKGLDCWSFFEVTMGIARMLETKKSGFTPSDLLAQIEHTRYRGGVCHGNYMDRIHFLAEWYKDNDKRKTIDDITRKFPTVEMKNQCNEMSKLWKHYRYLKMNPELRPLMAQSEREMTAMTVRMIPKSQVAGIEKHLKNGDIIGIARHKDGSYCSHVGIIVKDSAGQARFMHASTTYNKVVIDKTISGYLNSFNKHAGILIARPR